VNNQGDLTKTVIGKTKQMRVSVMKDTPLDGLRGMNDVQGESNEKNLM
jgi:hypothetical protein